MGLDIVEFQMQIEEQFDIDIPIEDAERLLTVKSVCEYIVQKNSLNGKELNLDSVFQNVKKIIEDTGYAEDNKIELNSRFVEDLGFD